MLRVFMAWAALRALKLYSIICFHQEKFRSLRCGQNLASSLIRLTTLGNLAFRSWSLLAHSIKISDVPITWTFISDRAATFIANRSSVTSIRLRDAAKAKACASPSSICLANSTKFVCSDTSVICNTRSGYCAINSTALTLIGIIFPSA